MDTIGPSLNNQVAVITGGGGGIGRAIALASASAGADIVIGDLIPARAEETAARVRELGRRAIAVSVDVRVGEEVRALVARAGQEFGRLDILVNNAGGARARPFLDDSERGWRRAMDLNLTSVLSATDAATPLMIAGGRGGSIVNVSSIEGSRAAPNFAVYAACKAAVNSLTRTFALEFAEHGIRVNAIAPDHTDTPGLHGNNSGPVEPGSWTQLDEHHLDAERRRIPLGRPGVDTECARAVVFLASSMSSYITGTTLPVDGGTWASSGWVRARDGSWALMGEAPIISLTGRTSSRTTASLPTRGGDAP